MKKLGTIFLSLVALATAFTSCTKNETPSPVPTALELTIKDIKGTTLISGASAKLYATSSDWQNGTNQIGATQTSDASGKVTFTNLEAKQYYFTVTKVDGCLSNVLTIPITYDPTTGNAAAITANKTTSLAIPVIGTTNITFTNNSTTNGWLVSVGTDKYYTVPIGFSGLAAMPTGTYTITMQEVDVNGAATSTPAETFDVDLNCGDTYTLIVP